MSEDKISNSSLKVYTKEQMYDFYLKDPINGKIDAVLDETRIIYFYFEDHLKLATTAKQVLNGCLLSGKATLFFEGKSYDYNQFDFFFIPPEKEILIKIDKNSKEKYKICLCSYFVEEEVKAEFEIQHFSLDKYDPRGEHGSEEKMATYRTVWTAIKNKYFMSGFTNIPQESLKQGVITSVNLEKTEEDKTEIYSHIHPDNPEVYIMCIDDENYAVTQYLINIKGQTVCRDLVDGEGLYFPGSLGHSNFARPTYKKLKYCQYLWIIPTYGTQETVSPTTLKV